MDGSRSRYGARRWRRTSAPRRGARARRPRGERGALAASAPGRGAAVSTMSRGTLLVGRPGRRPPGGWRPPAGTARGDQPVCDPVLRTFCSSVLALLTVALKFAPCMRAFIMVGMIASVASAVAQFFELSGEIWVYAVAFRAFHSKRPRTFH